MSRTMQKPWFTCVRPNPTARLRLFCFPYAGGGPTVYHRWGQVLPPSIEVLSLGLPGRPPRLGERLLTDMTQIVAAALPEILARADKPMALFGHSMGAIIAFELARRLQGEPGVRLVHLCVSGRGAPQVPPVRKPIHQLPEPEFREAIRDLNGTPTEVLANQELMQLVLPALRADFEVCETYAYQPGPRLDCPVTAYAGQQDPELRPGSVDAWAELTSRNFSARKFPGDHFFLQTAQSALLQTLTSELYQYIQ